MKFFINFLFVLNFCFFGFSSQTFSQYENKKVAVLDFINDAGLSEQEAVYITNMVRGAARKSLPLSQYILMTKENILALLPPGQSLSDCTGECAVETGRKIQADYVVSGEIIKFGGELRVTIMLYETLLGNLISNQRVGAVKLLALEDPIEESSYILFKDLPNALENPKQKENQDKKTEIKEQQQVKNDSDNKKIPEPIVEKTADPEFEKLVKEAQAKIEAEKRIAAEIQAQLEADYESVKKIHDDEGIDMSAKEPSYKHFIDKWKDDSRYRPQVEIWLKQGEVPEGFVLISPGSFTMGSQESESGRGSHESQHQVTLTKGFYISRYEVTQSLYEEIMGTNPSYFKGSDLPVEEVSWFDAVEFCNKLSDSNGKTRAYTINGQNVTWNQNANGYRLPTEAEWEYACRAGSTSAFYNGSITNTGEAPNCDKIAWYYYNSSSKTHAVGGKTPNAWGLSDMSGNVWEWCWDWYGSYSGSETDPVGPVSGSFRVMRGGGWASYAQYCRSANRRTCAPEDRGNGVGVRLVFVP